MKPYDRTRLTPGFWTIILLVAVCALSACKPTPSPGPNPSRSPSPAPTAVSLVGVWNGQLNVPGVGTLAVKTIFTASGGFSQVTVGPLYNVGITGDYQLLTDQGIIRVSNQQAHPEQYCPAGPSSCQKVQVPSGASYKFTFVDDNTLQLQDLNPACASAGFSCTISYSRG